MLLNRALKRQVPCLTCTSKFEHSERVDALGLRAVEVIICMITRDHQRDINDVTGVSLSLSLSLSQKSLTHNIGSASALPIIYVTQGFDVIKLPAQHNSPSWHDLPKNDLRFTLRGLSSGLKWFYRLKICIHTLRSDFQWASQPQGKWWLIAPKSPTVNPDYFVCTKNFFSYAGDLRPFVLMKFYCHWHSIRMKFSHYIQTHIIFVRELLHTEYTKRKVNANEIFWIYSTLQMRGWKVADFEPDLGKIRSLIFAKLAQDNVGKGHK